MKIKTETFLLPIYWASYLINGDASGYTDDELIKISEWETTTAPGPCLDCASTVDLCYMGDDGPGMQLRCTYTFQVLDACAAYADGEVVAWH